MTKQITIVLTDDEAEFLEALLQEFLSMSKTSQLVYPDGTKVNLTPLQEKALNFFAEIISANVKSILEKLKTAKVSG